MKEVSSRVFNVFLKPLAAKQVPVERIIEGTNVTVAQFRSKRERIDWNDFAAVMYRLREHFTDDEYTVIGRRSVHTATLRFAGVIARLSLSPLEFYRLMNKPQKGAGNQLFTCIAPTMRELSETEIELDLILDDGYDMVWDFFPVTMGSMEEIPAVLGYGRAQVRLTRLPRGGRYHITIPKGVPLLRRIRRLLTWPFTVRTAARELQDAHESLLEQYQELEAARTMIDRQAAHLRTAHTVNDLLLRDLELTRLLDTVVKALVEEAGFTWAEVSLVGTENEPSRSTHFGAEDHEPPLRRTLESAGGQVIGEFAVSPRASDTLQEREDLLTLIAPTLATGLQNALYRTNLERLVEVRTAELTQAHLDLTRTVAQLREAQASRERFFGNISHEIRTPLTIIMLAAADIEARAGALLDSRARAGLVSVTDASRKLVRLVDELLLLAAGQEGKLRIHPEPTDLVALVRQLTSAWLPGAEAAKLSLEAKLPETLVANVDPVAIERVASNLMSNAVKYTPAGGRIDIELVEEADGVRISVLDTGPGIGEELASRLFGRFERSAGDDRRKVGTGLGLSLVKQLVEAHGGTVEARPRPGGGAELRVMLPSSLVLRDAPRPTVSELQLGPEQARPLEIQSGARIAPPGPAKGTVVLAEDDTALAEMIAKLLSEEYVVLVAHDGVTAFDLVRAHQPQLLITDVEMPGMNGLELAKAFRDHTGDKVAPIIILSAVIDLGTRIAGLDAGAIDYITKPFDPMELRARVRAQFRMRSITLRLQKAEQLSSLGILTTGLAHELRNPANGIVNAIGPLIELLPDNLKDPDHAVRQLLDVVQTCSDQIAFLSRQLLGFRRGDVDLDVRPIPLMELLERSVSLAQRALQGVEVRKTFDRGLEVTCAPPLMTQVLTNLVENAGHAAGRGGWIEVSAHIAPDRVSLVVFDSGPGISLDLRERVFEPFFTTKPVGVGTGLGLSVARDIIHRHGGSLEIRDRDSSSCFVIELPNGSAVGRRKDAVS